MTELEKIEYARSFIDKLANGINPLDDTAVKDDDIINNVRLSRCFFYVSDILRQVIENGGTAPVKKPKKLPFALKEGAIADFEYSETPIPVSEITKRISALKENDNMRDLSHKDITGWLMETGLLCEKVNTVTGKVSKWPTEQGEEIGITTDLRSGQYGSYTVVLYDRGAQEFIVDNFDGIMLYKNSK